MDVLHDARHHLLETLPGHVGLKLGHRARLLLTHRPRHRAREPRAHLGDRARRGRVGALQIRLCAQVGVREDRDGVAQMIEHDHHVGQHQRHVGQLERVGIGGGERLDGAHQVVGEETHRTALKRRRVGHRRLAEASHVVGRQHVRVAAVAGRPA